MGNYTNIQSLIDFLVKNKGFKKTKKMELIYQFFDLKTSKVDQMPEMSYGQLGNQQQIETYTTDGKETTNIGNIGDIVICGPSKEKYVIKKENFLKFYQGNIGEKVIPNQSPRTVAKITPEILDALNLDHNNLKFTASWGESMPLKAGDYLVKDGENYYRIAKIEYEKTYDPVEAVQISQPESESKIMNYEKFLKRLFESKENYKILATNSSYWSWEDDSVNITARILLNQNDNSLYLKINEVHTKTGLGAGSFPKDLEYVKFGNLQKADLALVRSLLKKHSIPKSRAAKGFSIFWEDDEGNKMSLGDLIKMYKAELPKRELKHIKKIDLETETEKPNKDIELIQYSDRSYALFGEGTKQIKDELISLGCRYNRFLTNPSTGQKRPGWIFSINKLNKVKELI